MTKLGALAVFVVVGLNLPLPCFADEPASAPVSAETAPVKPYEPRRKLFSGSHVGGIASISRELPTVALGIIFDPGFLIGISAGLSINPNGLPSTTGAPTANKVGALLGVYVHYSVVNRPIFSTGPEIAVRVALAPVPAGVAYVEPGWAFWYAPWQAPIALGAAWDVRLEFTKGRQPVFDLFSPAIRIAYAIK